MGVENTEKEPIAEEDGRVDVLKPIEKELKPIEDVLKPMESVLKPIENRLKPNEKMLKSIENELKPIHLHCLICIA
jgi:hypothetical protein